MNERNRLLYCMVALLCGSLLFIYGCTETLVGPATGVELCVTKQIDFPLLDTTKKLFDTASFMMASCSIDTVHISKLTISPSVFSFTAPPQTPITIAPGDTSRLQVKYIPTDATADIGTIAIESNAGSLSIPLSGGGIGLSPNIVFPKNINCGIARLGICDDDSLGAQVLTTVKLHNTGVKTIHITWGPLSLPFIFVSKPDSIKAGDSASISIHFCPSVVGAATQNLIVKTDSKGSDSSAAITILGTGVVYIPAKGSVWQVFDSQLFKPVNYVLQDSNSSVVKGNTDILYVSGEYAGILNKMDTSFFVSTININNISFYVNTTFLANNEPQKAERWLKFPLPNTTYIPADTSITIFDSIIAIHDTVTAYTDTSKTIGSETILFHRAFWERTISSQLTISPKYTKVLLSYSPHLGMIFIDKVSGYDQLGNPIEYTRSLIKYNFK